MGKRLIAIELRWDKYSLNVERVRKISRAELGNRHLKAEEYQDDTKKHTGNTHQLGGE